MKISRIELMRLKVAAGIESLITDCLQKVN
jgi:hypothetical protein